MQLSEQEKENIFNKLEKHTEDISQIKNKMGTIENKVGIIAEQLSDNDRVPHARLCALHEEKLKIIEETLQKLKSNDLVMARNGSAEKKERPLKEVVAETHEAIYFLKPFGLFMLFIYDFVRKHKIWTTIILFTLITLHDKIFQFISYILGQPGNLFAILIKKYLNLN